jgi:hypothetical protein
MEMGSDNQQWNRFQVVGLHGGQRRSDIKHGVDWERKFLESSPTREMYWFWAQEELATSEHLGCSTPTDTHLESPLGCFRTSVQYEGGIINASSANGRLVASWTFLTGMSYPH